MLGKAEACIKAQAPVASTTSKNPNEVVTFLIDGLCAVEVQRFEAYQRNVMTLASWRSTPVKPTITVDAAHPSEFGKAMLDQAAQTNADLAKVTIDPDTGEMVTPPGFRPPIDMAGMMSTIYRGVMERARFQAVAAAAVLAADQAAGGKH